LISRAIVDKSQNCPDEASVSRLRRRDVEGDRCKAVLVPITYWPLTPDELFERYALIDFAAQIPVGIYDNPGTTGIDMKPGLIARIADIDNVAFVKDSSGDPNRMIELAELTHLDNQRKRLGDAFGGSGRRARWLREAVV
jgi:dihydrodipicolinate synthase/N-acetylneuraminate lyase